MSDWIKTRMMRRSLEVAVNVILCESEGLARNHEKENQNVVNQSIGWFVSCVIAR
jgi:hypothetical protein